MSLRNITFNAAFAALLLAPTLAFAHTGVGGTSGFAHGFSHPMSGLDHLLAMVMVGVLAWQLGGRATWIMPSTFVLVMAFGGALGVGGISVPFVEAGIALSVVVLGAIVAFGIQAPVAIVCGLVGLFAVFHGHAHGSEMPAAASALSYASGFMIATALLHGVGLALGYLVGRLGDSRGPLLTRAAGGIATVAGIGLLTGLI
ncbi:urease accessory protein [Rhizobium sp. Root708]|uniref:HupE/UreJ family protein n=1 Tax=Rhizobium sp. Root708 TaxID=1736592 RepID=UPI0006FCD880|nr:HupE/UreJ family protein [Rhizobium sp. Root708]KRB61193.1 urease accessory protein [Rhizobium sp. Root708]